MNRLLVVILVTAMGCTTDSARTTLLERAHQASEQLDQGSTETFPSDVTQLISRADQLRTGQPGAAETTTDFLSAGVSASIEVDHDDKVLLTTPVLELLDAATQLSN